MIGGRECHAVDQCSPIRVLSGSPGCHKQFVQDQYHGGPAHSTRTTNGIVGPGCPALVVAMVMTTHDSDPEQVGYRATPSNREKMEVFHLLHFPPSARWWSSNVIGGASNMKWGL